MSHVDNNTKSSSLCLPVQHTFEILLGGSIGVDVQQTLAHTLRIQQHHGGDSSAGGVVWCLLTVEHGEVKKLRHHHEQNVRKNNQNGCRMTSHHVASPRHVSLDQSVPTLSVCGDMIISIVADVVVVVVVVAVTFLPVDGVSVEYGDMRTNKYADDEQMIYLYDKHVHYPQRVYTEYILGERGGDVAYCANEPTEDEDEPSCVACVEVEGLLAHAQCNLDEVIRGKDEHDVTPRYHKRTEN